LAGTTKETVHFVTFMGAPEAKPIEVLLVEDNDDDLDLALRALKKRGLTQAVEVARDGSEAIDFLFGTGRYAWEEPERDPAGHPPRHQAPPGERTGSAQGGEGRPPDSRHPRGRAELGRISRRTSKRRNSLGANSYIVKPVDFDKFTESIGDVGAYWLTTTPCLRRSPNTEAG
jgi:hypothetical protein